MKWGHCFQAYFWMGIGGRKAESGKWKEGSNGERKGNGAKG
tara:strand:+ start:231 stop:353 length:123 start_codon:yes stop_codon:yes gene_type:complete